MSQPKPLPKVSADRYQATAARPAKIRIRIKGQPDGPVFEGQRVIKPCRGCGGRFS